MNSSRTDFTRTVFQHLTHNSQSQRIPYCWKISSIFVVVVSVLATLLYRGCRSCLCKGSSNKTCSSSSSYARQAATHHESVSHSTLPPSNANHCSSIRLPPTTVNDLTPLSHTPRHIACSRSHFFPLAATSYAYGSIIIFLILFSLYNFNLDIELVKSIF